MTRNHRDSQFWQWVIAKFRLGTKSSHGPRHWLTVLRNGLYLYQHHSVEIEVVRLFALFHDSCRHNEYGDPRHGPRGAELAIAFRKADHFELDESRMDLLTTDCGIHNGGAVQSGSTLAFLARRLASPFPRHSKPGKKSPKPTYSHRRTHNHHAAAAF